MQFQHLHYETCYSVFVPTPRNHVTINSGRDHYTLEKWLGDLPLSFAAEHGAFYKEKRRMA